jgi:hypothetical protein
MSKSRGVEGLHYFGCILINKITKIWLGVLCHPLTHPKCIYVKVFSRLISRYLGPSVVYIKVSQST